ncbi:hypothetical protein, partial [Bartonella bovis]|uniref:hypothetical protein n=1 Tax=Bartonella bovis TaxID=155194 RepID=UPI001956D2BA
LTDVNISQVEKGVLIKKGNLTMTNGSITFKGGEKNYGIGVWGEGGETTANITGTRITGGGSGEGMGVIMGGREMTMTGVNISQVKMGVWVGGGTVTVSGGSMTGVQTGITMSGSGTLVVNNGARIEFTSGGTRNYGIGVGGTVNATITGVEIKG